MIVLALVGGLLLCVALGLREYQLARERTAFLAALDHLRQALEVTRRELRRTAEDMYVVQALLVERNVLDEAELQRGRVRLIEAPRRMAEERDAIAKHLKVSPVELVIDEGDTKVH